MELTVTDEVASLRDFSMLEWFAQSHYIGKMQLNKWRDQSGLWFQLQDVDLDICLDVYEEEKVCVDS